MPMVRCVRTTQMRAKEKERRATERMRRKTEIEITKIQSKRKQLKLDAQIIVRRKRLVDSAQ